MMLIAIKRIIKWGWKGFLHNKSASLATVFIIAIVVFLLSSLLVFHHFTQFVISDVLEKVDVSIYFKETAPAEDILELKNKMAKIPEIKSVEYISKEEALEKFSQRHKNNPVIMESVNEVGNFCLASLNIRTWKASQYGAVINFLKNSTFQDIIDHTNYSKSKAVIDKVFSLTSNLKSTGIALSVFLSLLAVLVAFNTVRLAIINSREEISIMRLVGASNWFIRGPFIVQGLISSLIAVALVVVLFTLGCYFIGAKIEVLVPGADLFGYLTGNFLTILSVQLATGLSISAVSSAIAIRKYLRV